MSKGPLLGAVRGPHVADPDLAARQIAGAAATGPPLETWALFRDVCSYLETCAPFSCALFPSRRVTDPPLHPILPFYFLRSSFIQYLFIIKSIK